MENNKVFVLSRHDCTGLADLVDGVYGVFTTLEKAQLEATKHIAADELLLDWDADAVQGLWNYFSDKATYHIERVQLDDTFFD